jgi:7-cyano-7-deazaguanine synthase
VRGFRGKAAGPQRGRGRETLNYTRSHGFLARFCLICGRLGDVWLLTPLVDLCKAQVIQRGSALGVVYASTYSRLLGHAVHCGRCPQCRQRRAAFEAAGCAEPAAFYRDRAGSRYDRPCARSRRFPRLEGAS